MAFFDISENDLPGPTTTSFEPLPAGWYTASIQSVELKDTKAGTGQYMAIKYSIIAPTHQGRVVFGNINVRNPNPKAEEIGRQQLGEIMRAGSLSRMTDTDQLIGINLQIKLAIKHSEEYGDGNEIKGFKSVATMPTAANTTDTEQPKKAAPPWAKK